MAVFDDLDFRTGNEPDLPPPSGRPPLWQPIAAGAVLVVLLLGLWYLGTHRKAPAPEPARPAARAAVEPPRRGAAEPGEAIDLPPIDESDALIRTLVTRLSSHPKVAAWLTTDHLIRNIAAVINNVAEGDTPAKHLRAVRPAGAFPVKKANGQTLIDPAGYKRYDAIADAVEAVDARGVARFYATVKPRISEAFVDLGTSDPDVDHAVERAIVMLLRTPIVDHDVQLRTDKVTYGFADPALENLSKVQRQFLRMGPRNVQRVQLKLREVAHYLGIPDAALPPPTR